MIDRNSEIYSDYSEAIMRAWRVYKLNRDWAEYQSAMRYAFSILRR